MTKKLNSILAKESLSHLLPLFEDQGVTDSILVELNDGDLRELGIEKLGDRKRLLAAFEGSPSSGEGFRPTSGMVAVEGGVLPAGSQLAGTKVGAFGIGIHAVTMQEWRRLRAWGFQNGFGFEVGQAGGPQHPITMVSWYDCLKFCNAKSVMEGLEPVYGVKGQKGLFKSGEFGNEGGANIIMRPKANGYRIPLEAEWEWAARGGVRSQGYTYAGSNYADEVAWYTENSGGGTHPVGEKAPNELGLLDMSGNVREWCFDAHDDPPHNRRIRGGYWGYPAGFCAVSDRDGRAPDNRSPDYGLRLARSSGN